MQIRPATPGDYDAYAALVRELGVDDPVPDAARFAAELVPRMLVATVDGVVVGYSLHEVLADTGYVRNIVSAPGHRRRGIGAALMQAMRDHFAAAGATGWCLNVKPDNAAAIGLYERFGLVRAYRTTALQLSMSTPLPAPTADLTLAPVPPDADAVVEPAMGLLRGQLASARTRMHRRVVQLLRGGELAGVAVFSTTIPGAFPFRVVEPALGAALLFHLRPLAPAGAAYVRVSVENDDALRDAVLALGATVHQEIEHMRGPLAVAG